MKICAVQTRPFKGDIPRNLVRHQQLSARAIASGADVVVFPELSLTGYEPTLAKALATTSEDPRLAPLQALADAQAATLAVGLPTRSAAGPCISLVIFQPHQPRQTYSKQYLHADEEPFFVAGANLSSLTRQGSRVALAICYELSVPEHAQAAHRSGADLYVASVAKTAAGVETASQRLAIVAHDYSMAVLMANGVGPADTFESAGGSAVWNRRGELLGRLDGEEGLLLYDTVTEEVAAIAG